MGFFLYLYFYFIFSKKCSKGNNTMNCNDIIKRLRAQNLYTQQYVADELNICQRTYCDYELRLY